MQIALVIKVIRDIIIFYFPIYHALKNFKLSSMYCIIIKINLIYEETKEKPDALVNHIFEMQHVQTCPQIFVIDML